jgi:hypothetical protein
LPWAGPGTSPLDQEVLLEKARLYWQNDSPVGAGHPAAGA